MIKWLGPALAQSGDIFGGCPAAFMAERDCGTLLLTGGLTQTGHDDEYRANVPQGYTLEGYMLKEERNEHYLYAHP